MEASGPLRVLHIAPRDKFLPGFMTLVDRHPPRNRQRFFIETANPPAGAFPARPRAHLFSVRSLTGMLRLLREMLHADRIILHGLFHQRVLLLLCLLPWLPRRCRWLIWGRDLYAHLGPVTRIERLKRRLVPRLGGLVSYVPGDVALARRWYGARCRHFDCLLYPSNTCPAMPAPGPRSGRVVVLAGNSADPGNRHDELFRLLRRESAIPFSVLCPLSYGDQAYAEATATAGRALWGEDFQALRELMPADDYLRLLAGVDAAVFAHRRQQAMGNIITLLGLGRKVYLNPRTATWHLLTSLGLDVFPLEAFTVQGCRDFDGSRNRAIIQRSFAAERLVAQLRRLL